MEVAAGRLTIRKASDLFNVKRSTLSDFMKKGEPKKIGKPTLLSPNEEKYLAEMIDAVAEWGFPVGTWDVKMMASDLLKAEGYRCWWSWCW